jgi:uncharacterized protein YbjT (DUF2867 family)
VAPKLEATGLAYKVRIRSRIAPYDLLTLYGLGSAHSGDRQRRTFHRLLEAGDSHASISFLQRIPFQIVFGRAYEDKSLQERLIKKSGLGWTIVRPGVLTGGPRTGRYRILREAPHWRNGIISRSDVAEFLVRQIEDQAYVRQAPVLVN